ncbi:MAG: hypothetical protein K2X77_13780 [Candidatus Obscuribacterales bacterium]|nr:hypothetical protein [Candidatus Obscuribacterales bacterium]
MEAPLSFDTASINHDTAYGASPKHPDSTNAKPVQCADCKIDGIADKPKGFPPRLGERGKTGTNDHLRVKAKAT